MEPNYQLFGHYLRYRMDMQQGMAEQHDKKYIRMYEVQVSGRPLGSYSDIL